MNAIKFKAKGPRHHEAASVRRLKSTVKELRAYYGQQLQLAVVLVMRGSLKPETRPHDARRFRKTPFSVRHLAANIDGHWHLVAKKAEVFRIEKDPEQTTVQVERMIP